MKRTIIASLFVIGWVGLSLTAGLMTADAQRGGARATAQAEATQRGASAAPNGPQNLQATLQAAQPDTSGIQATLAAVSTTYANVDYQATLQAAAAYGNFPATVEAARAGSTVTLNDDGTATITTVYDEATINAAVSSALAAAGYPGAAVDLLPGVVRITVPNVTYQNITGTVSADFAVSAVGGRASIALTAVTLNGRALPGDVVASLAVYVNGAVQALLDTAAGSISTAYTVDALVVSDTTLTATFTVATPAPTRTPRP